MTAPLVVVADPAWEHRDTGIRCGTKKHYRTMSVGELCRLEFPEPAADAWLFIWCTHNHHLEAHTVAKAWGFPRYRSEGVWVKTSSKGTPRIGGGHTLRQAHEKFLLFSRGKPQRVSKGVPSVILAPHRTLPTGQVMHSGKPEEFYSLVEQFAQGPYLELFARRTRPGWVCLGDEVNKEQVTWKNK